MAVDIDGLPYYDPLIKFKPDLLSDIWVGNLSRLIDTLTGYLSQNGIFIPLLTTSQRDQIQSPQLGQFIYNTTTNELQVWQVKPPANPSWHVITTTP